MIENRQLVQSLLTMKFLWISALLALLITSCLSDVRTHDFSARIKNGFFHIDLKNNRAILTIEKNDGARMKNELITKNPKKSIFSKLSVKHFTSKLNPRTTSIVIEEINTNITLENEKEIVKIEREVDHRDGQLIDCYELTDDAQWFGGPQTRYQHWPIQNMYYEEEPYVPTQLDNMAITERYWLSSRGIYIYVNEMDPLFVDQNNHKDKHLCLISKNKNPYPAYDKVTLRYYIGVFHDAKTAHRHAVAHHLGHPTGHPSPLMVQNPIWSTWAQYKVHINEAVVMKFAKAIKDHGFNHSQLEIDDNWETCYGSAEFDPIKFPDVPRFVKQLKDMGFDVTLWIHPFINENCEESYVEAYEKGYFVKNHEGEVHTTWWQGKKGAAAIDFTNEAAVDWWAARLNKIKNMGIVDFKFDAGETSWLPQVPSLNGPKYGQPAVYTYNYTSNLARRFGDRIEVRSAWRGQKLPIFVRMIDKDSRWTWNNGLPTLITTLLQMNLNGYVFVLPDMIAGNGDEGENSLETVVVPPKELFIRWLQATVFMPSLQFSFVPWQYDNQTVEIAKKFTKLHAAIAPKIIELMKKAVDIGEPINTPIWWVDPSNAQAHKVFDEYLLGEEYLVAPVIEENAVSRDVYLPAGLWRDENTNKVHTGPVLLEDYPAPLDTLPYFKKVYNLP